MKVTAEALSMSWVNAVRELAHQHGITISVNSHERLLFDAMCVALAPVLQQSRVTTLEQTLAEDAPVAFQELRIQRLREALVRVAQSEHAPDMVVSEAMGCLAADDVLAKQLREAGSMPTPELVKA